MGLAGIGLPAESREGGSPVRGNNAAGSSLVHGVQVDVGGGRREWKGAGGGGQLGFLWRANQDST